MNRCDSCGKLFDDARVEASCPHKPFTTLIEATSKHTKRLRAYGIAGIALGGIGGAALVDVSENLGIVVGALIGLPGLVLYGYGLLLAWWDHG